jgi:hypothetical protein
MAKLPIPVTRPNDFETFADAKKRRAHKIRVLRKGDDAEQRLAAKLDRCHKGENIVDPARAMSASACTG